MNHFLLLFKGIRKSGKIALVALLWMLSFQISYGQKQMQRQVDVVICMDLSGSTNGLVDVFRDKMWDIINQWKMFTPAPSIRIGVVGFSRFSFTDGSGYVKVLSELTDDYDQLSSELFKIKPNVENGIQFVGAALETCLYDMQWSEKPNVLKIAYIMGNGEVSLGKYDYRKLCEEATKMKVVVNTVYCIKTLTQLREKELPGWQSIADLTGGSCYEINVTKRLPLIQTNTDINVLASLNDSLNGTCIPYGKTGMDHLKTMLETDHNATMIYGNYLYSRLKYKLSDHYQSRQLTWDVVTYKQAYPDSKLAAVRPSATSSQNVAIDLEKVVNTNLEKRLQLLETLKITLPKGEEEKIHGQVGEDAFELGNMLDRVLIFSFYKQAVAAGFKN